MKLRISNVIAIIALLLSIVLVVCICINHWNLVGLSESMNNNENLYPIVSALMAIANALLLYSTIMSQGLLNKRDRYENILFHLLENHEKLVNRTFFGIETLDDNYNKVKSKIDEEHLFSYAIREVVWIKDVIKYSSYPDLSDDDFQVYLADVENRKEGLSDAISVADLNTEKNELISFYEMSRRTEIYNIDFNKWNVTRSSVGQKEKIEKIAYAFFFQKWKRFYEPYFRSLSLILMHIDSNDSLNRKEKTFYKDYVVKQMTTNELSLIKLHCLYDSGFYAQIKRVSYKPVPFFNNLKRKFRN